jgi:transmembrane sensor
MSLDGLLSAGRFKVRDVWSPEKTASLPHDVLQRCRRRALKRASAGAVIVGASIAVLPLLLPARNPELLLQSSGLPNADQITAVMNAAQPAAAPLTVKLLTFKDGSRAELAGSVSRLNVERDSKERVNLRLLAGHARFEVVPNVKRSFEVRAGAVRVRVIGTSFSMARVSEQTRVSVHKGRVEVVWSGGETELAGGESGVFPPTGAAAENRLSKALPGANPKTADTSGAPEWRRLAQTGEYKSAYSALNDTPDSVRQVPEELLLAADVARLSGNPGRAIPYLRTVSERFSRDPRAPVAAFTLGRVLLENTGNAASAAAAFHRARMLSPGGPLALDAWAREVESLRRAGRAEQASDLARGYLDQYPNGRHGAAMRRIVGE